RWLSHSMKNTLYPTAAPSEQAFLVGVESKRDHNGFYLQDSLDELAQLCKTAGLEVVGQATQKLESPHPNTYIGKGKLAEVVAWQRELDFDVLGFDEELMPRQKRELANVAVVAIVGYTNAGKSTLLNALSHAHVRAEDKLFATLDPTTRRVRLPSGHDALFTDTVGFIQKLPTQLVASFRATLEE